MTERAYPQPRVPGEAVAYVDLDAAPNAPHWARCVARSSLRAWRLWPETIETAELLISELVTNSVKACDASTRDMTYPEMAGGERVSVTLRNLSGRVSVEVFDSDHKPPLPASAGADDESGRGLMLVAALSTEWGYFLTPAGGKVVYFILSQ